MRFFALLAGALAATVAVLAQDLKVDPEGACGNGFTCIGGVWGECCSQHGWCGSTTDYCDTGCQSDFGNCNSPVQVTSTIYVTHTIDEYVTSVVIRPTTEIMLTWLTKTRWSTSISTAIETAIATQFTTIPITFINTITTTAVRTATDYITNVITKTALATSYIEETQIVNVTETSLVTETEVETQTAIVTNMVNSTEVLTVTQTQLQTDLATNTAWVTLTDTTQVTVEVSNVGPAQTLTVIATKTQTLAPVTLTQTAVVTMTVTAAPVATAGHYAQCGGAEYSGVTGCVAPYTCSSVNSFFSQCV
ncbi:hypothetical protein F4778DRAFT_780038 [Xylariomycetidae sp. FL2044]|nr:hypothetical protein F4778DRAFT_780038 [Xylariomycetidae sp. FL2044]